MDSFLDRFLSLRSLAHKRRVRVEKLQEILRRRSEDNPTIITSSTGISQEPSATPSAWNPETTATTTTNHQPNSKPQSSRYTNVSQPACSTAGGSSCFPYSQYPISLPIPPPVVAAAAAGSGQAIPPSQFHPYPGSNSLFTPALRYTGPRPAFGPSAACPYPTQPSLPAPIPGSAFGQYTPTTPQSGPAPYPASYSYGGYSYPSGSAYSQSPTGRPIYRPGNGVPQP